MTRLSAQHSPTVTTCDILWFLQGVLFLIILEYQSNSRNHMPFPFSIALASMFYPRHQIGLLFLLKYINATYCTSIKIHWLCLTSFSNMSRSNSFQPDRDTGCDPVRLWHNQKVGRRSIEEVNLIKHKKNETQSCFRLSSHNKTLIPLAKRQGMCGVV